MTVRSCYRSLAVRRPPDRSRTKADIGSPNLNGSSPPDSGRSPLPSVMRASLSRLGELNNLSGVARLTAEEIDRRALGGGYVVGRLLEVLCAEAMRSHVETLSRDETGWFRGIKDPIVGKALAAVHARPGDDWSVQRLACRALADPNRSVEQIAETLAYQSPAAFSRAFKKHLGVSPAAWKARTAD